MDKELIAQRKNPTFKSQRRHALKEIDKKSYEIKLKVAKKMK